MICRSGNMTIVIVLQLQLAWPKLSCVYLIVMYGKGALLVF